MELWVMLDIIFRWGVCGGFGRCLRASEGFFKTQTHLTLFSPVFFKRETLARLVYYQEPAF